MPRSAALVLALAVSSIALSACAATPSTASGPLATPSATAAVTLTDGRAFATGTWDCTGKGFPFDGFDRTRTQPFTITIGDDIVQARIPAAEYQPYPWHASWRGSTLATDPSDLGSGAWRWTVPFPAKVPSTGTATLTAVISNVGDSDLRIPTTVTFDGDHMTAAMRITDGEQTLPMSMDCTKQ